MNDKFRLIDIGSVLKRKYFRLERTNKDMVAWELVAVLNNSDLFKIKKAIEKVERVLGNG